MILRDYQQQCVEAILSGFRQHRDLLAVLATGLGKTMIGSALIAEWHRREMPGRCLWLAHREELIDQAAETIRRSTHLRIAIEKGESYADEYGFEPSPVVIGSVPTLAKPRRRRRFKPERFGLIITDEAHHSLARSYRAIYDYFRKGHKAADIEGNPEVRHLGITATPHRSDDLAMGRVFDEVVFNYPIDKAIHEGYLVPVKQAVAIVEDLDLSKLKVVKGDYLPSQLEEVLTDPAKKIVLKMGEPIVAHAGDKPAIVFTAGKKQATLIAHALNGWRPGLAGAVTDETPKEERRRIIKDFKEGRLQFLCNCGIATEGFDAASVGLVAIARPTQSLTLYTQMLGRATRPLPGTVDGPPGAAARRSAIANSAKPFATVLDFVGNVQRHGEQATVSAADILGGNYSAAVRNYASQSLREKPGSRLVEKELDRAQAELALLSEEEDLLSAIVAEVDYQVRYLDSPISSPRRHEQAARRGERATSKQIWKLAKLGVPRYKAERCTKGQARGWIGKLLAEKRKVQS